MPPTKSPAMSAAFSRIVFTAMLCLGKQGAMVAGFVPNVYSNSMGASAVSCGSSISRAGLSCVEGKRGLGRVRRGGRLVSDQARESAWRRV